MARSKAEPRAYHHGDLRAALLKAAEEELAESGVDGFTLRNCARRAGVSHAAPAHHFGDAAGLLTEVAIDGFTRLAARMQAEAAKVEPGSIDHPIAAALGYVLFAVASPAHFKLVFRNEKLDAKRPDLRRAASGAFMIAAESIGAYLRLPSPMTEPVATRKVIALWSLSHGFASLLIAEQLGPIAAGEKVARALIPDIVRELLGEKPSNDPRDLKFIARTSEAQRS